MLFLNENISLILSVIAGGFFGFLLCWILGKRQKSQAQSQQQDNLETIKNLQEKISQQEYARISMETKEKYWQELKNAHQLLQEEKQQLTRELVMTQEKLKYIQADDQVKRQEFSAIAQQALQQAHQTFVHMAQQTLQTSQVEQRAELGKQYQTFLHQTGPLSQDLNKYQQKLAELQNIWNVSYSDIKTQLQQVEKINELARLETHKLSSALRQSPRARGRWGETALRNILEMAGMNSYCDFTEQARLPLEKPDDVMKRPDVTIRLPSDRTLVIDSKVVLEAYLQAIEASDEQQKNHYLELHSRNITDCLQRLHRKDYASGTKGLDLVILFIPGDHFYNAALEVNPNLFEDAFQKKIIIATPTTLIALLRVIEWGWRQHNSQNAMNEISGLTDNLHKEWQKTSAQWVDLGKVLSKSLSQYNKIVSDFEKNIFPLLSKVTQFQPHNQKAIYPETKNQQLNLPQPHLWNERKETVYIQQNGQQNGL